MPRNTFDHPWMPARRLFEVSRVNKPTIKILLYTDAPRLVTKSRAGMFGLGQMIQHLQGHAPAFARLDIRWMSRYLANSPDAVNKLDTVLKTEFDTTGTYFDQVWFFGIHQINKTKPGLGLGGGTRESELTAAEVKALTTWMEEQQGGVLVTGDHANRSPDTAMVDDPGPACPDQNRKEQFLSLGRALGRCIPRAGLLRDWEGDPTGDPQRSHNTHTAVVGVMIEDAALQRDGNPQRIFHKLFDANGQPAENGDPHPLFFYSDGKSIEYLPDHMHEGAVVIPTPLDKNVWRANSQGFRPEPHLVATGMDSRRRKEVNLLAAYDGTALNCGRIVADSSWHHYFNINLENFRFPEPRDSPGDQIGQFYANLAVWLSPISKRKQMAESMVRWLANQPVVLEAFGPSRLDDRDAIRGTGNSALAVLKRVASPCEIHELLRMTLAAERRERFENHYLPDTEAALAALPSKALVLGYLVNHYALNTDEFPESTMTFNKEPGETRAIDLSGASELAFKQQRDQVVQTLRSAEEAIDT